MAKREPKAKVRMVDCRVWDVMRMRGYDDSQKALWMYLLTGPGTHFTGIWVLSVHETAESLYWQSRKGHPDTKRVSRLLSWFEQAGRLWYDGKARVVLMANWMDYKPIRSKDTAQGAAVWLKTLPQSPLIERWFERSRLFLPEEIVHTVRFHFEHKAGEGSPRGVPGGVRGTGLNRGGGDPGGDKEVGSRSKEIGVSERGEGSPQQGPRPGQPQHALSDIVGHGDGRSGTFSAPSLSPAHSTLPLPDPATGPIIQTNASHQQLITFADQMGIDTGQIQHIETLHHQVELALRLSTRAMKLL